MLICLDQRTGTGCGAQNRDGAQHCSKCGMSLRFALQLQNPGAMIGHYRIARVLGHGGFGAVYEAEDTQQPGLHVALKETFDPTSIGSYQKEFAVLRTLQHPNLPRYYEMFEYQGNGYLVMELVPGQSLEDVLDSQPGQPLLESQVMGYAIQVCDALTYLHSQTPPIIHRDIKPANIRITPAGLIKLVDFGLVKQGTGTTQSSRRGLTPAYAPIEQYGLVAGLHTDPRSDIYALGATLYHLLTGQPPLPAADRIAVTPDPLPHPQHVNPRISPHVAGAVMAAMNLLPKDRHADVKMMKQALMGIVRSAHAPISPTVAPQVASLPQALSIPPGPPLAVTLVAVFFAITGVLGLIAGSLGFLTDIARMPLIEEISYLITRTAWMGKNLGGLGMLSGWGLGLIGIVAGIGVWVGKTWARWLGILYLMAGIALIGLVELGILYCYYCGASSPRVIAGAVSVTLVMAGFYALVLLFQPDLLDYFYPRHAPHRKWAGQSVTIVAWSQILLGFWLVVPLVLGIGLLYRKRWALYLDRLLLWTVTGVAVSAFVVGLTGQSDRNWQSFVLMSVIAQLSFLFATINFFLLTRPEVDALF